MVLGQVRVRLAQQRLQQYNMTGALCTEGTVGGNVDPQHPPSPSHVAHEDEDHQVSLQYTSMNTLNNKTRHETLIFLNIYFFPYKKKKGKMFNLLLIKNYYCLFSNFNKTTLLDYIIKIGGQHFILGIIFYYLMQDLSIFLIISAIPNSHYKNTFNKNIFHLLL
jgi:hypothetical protein